MASKLQHCCLLNKISSLFKALHTSPQPVTPVVEYSNPDAEKKRIRRARSARRIQPPAGAEYLKKTEENPESIVGLT